MIHTKCKQPAVAIPLSVIMAVALLFRASAAQEVESIERSRNAHVRVLVPAYFYPAGEGQKIWDRLLAAPADVPIVAIVNPASGPGEKPDPNYRRLVERAKKSSLTLIGYVTTSYGKRSLHEVKADVDRWIEFYPGIQGIFFDEQASGESGVGYQAELYDYVRRQCKLKLVITNPGTVCSERYFTQPACDLACVFEGPRTDKSLDLPAWLGRYSADRAVVLPYGVRSADEMKATLRAAIARNIGMLYVTDADGANPWNRLPSYWDEEVAVLREFNVIRAASPRHERVFQVVAYLPDYRLKAFDPAAAAGVTDLIFFSIECKPSGELDRRRLSDENLHRLNAIKERHNARLIVAVGGWGRSKDFGPMAVDAAARARFVDELTKLCRDEHLDGVDFDWEHPANASEEQAYAALLGETKRAFEPHGRSVSVTVAAWQNIPPAAFQAVDRVHLMAYDHDGRHSTLEQAKVDAETLVRKGAPKNKIVLGLPFYGRAVRDRSRERTYAEIVRQYKPAPDVDEVDGIYFNGLETIRAKTRHAQQTALGGVMIWELGQDTRDETSLLRAIRAEVSTNPK